MLRRQMGSPCWQSSCVTCSAYSDCLSAISCHALQPLFVFRRVLVGRWVNLPRKIEKQRLEIDRVVEVISEQFDVQNARAQFLRRGLQSCVCGDDSAATSMKFIASAWAPADSRAFAASASRLTRSRSTRSRRTTFRTPSARPRASNKDTEGKAPSPHLVATAINLISHARVLASETRRKVLNHLRAIPILPLKRPLTLAANLSPP